MNKNTLLLYFILCLTGCNKTKLDVVSLSNKDANQIYSIGNKYMDSQMYEEATSAFGELEKQYPYSKYIVNAELNSGLCLYKMKKYEKAKSVLETLVQTHPEHKSVSDALYLLGNIYFDQMPIVKRDQWVTIMSLVYFQELCARYPEYKNIQDAKNKIQLLTEHLASHEFRSGMYYQKHRNYVAAIARYNTIIEFYPKTKIADEAYYRLIECYLSLGFIQEVYATNQTLQSKNKDSKWAGYALSCIEREKQHLLRKKDR